MKPPRNPSEDMMKTTVNSLVGAAKTPRCQETLDGLIDCRPATAASRISKMDEDDVRVALLAAVTGVMRRYRVPAELPAEPEARADEIAARTRRVIADVLIENPESILPTLQALSDATATFDPRQKLPTGE